MLAPISSAAPTATAPPGPPAETAESWRPPKMLLLPSNIPACQLIIASTAPRTTATTNWRFLPPRAHEPPCRTFSICVNSVPLSLRLFLGIMLGTEADLIQCLPDLSQADGRVVEVKLYQL